MMRVLPPSKGDRPTITVFDRVYTCPLGSYLDVPTDDGQRMTANKWTKAADGVGATAQRPVTPWKGMTYMDTTLGFLVVFDELVWRNPATGVQV